MIETTFGNWTVISGPERRPKPQGGSRIFWLCRCTCGTERMVNQAHLRGGRSTGCGCDRVGRPLTHGHNSSGRRSPELSSYRAMMDRCTQPSHVGWLRYGGAGITVCDRWKCSFETFLADMGPKPSPRHTLERVDGSKGYEPGNCIWATPREQNLNTSRTHWVEFGGEKLCLQDAADRAGISRETLRRRIQKGLPKDLWFVQGRHDRR